MHVWKFSVSRLMDRLFEVSMNLKSSQEENNKPSIEQGKKWVVHGRESRTNWYVT